MLQLLLLKNPYAIRAELHTTGVGGKPSLPLSPSPSHCFIAVRGYPVQGNSYKCNNLIGVLSVVPEAVGLLQSHFTEHYSKAPNWAWGGSFLPWRQHAQGRSFREFFNTYMEKERGGSLWARTGAVFGAAASSDPASSPLGNTQPLKEKWL